MLSLISLDDRIDLVCSVDPDVAIDGAAPAGPEWVAPGAEGVTVGADATIVTVRALSSTETALLAPDGLGNGSMAMFIGATRSAVVRVRGPALDISKRAELVKWLDRLPLQLRAPLGGTIVTRSMLLDDPTEPAE